MKLRTKIVIIFLASIMISVIVFIIATGYMMSKGLWSGYVPYNMYSAVKVVSKDIKAVNTFQAKKTKPIFEKWEEKYKGMQFKLLSEKMEVLYSSDENTRLYSMESLLDDISSYGNGSKKEWVSAGEVVLPIGDKGIIVAIVPKELYAPVAFIVNGSRGVGILGKIFLAGMIITLIISTIFAVIFTLRTSRRFSRLYKGIGSFELGNMDVVIPDKSKDEIGRLAKNFNVMADKLKIQFDQEKEYQEERRKLVSNISHDLRTPLTSIIGYSESLENGVYESEEEQRRYIGIIRRRAIYMEKLLGELLEFSRMESGNFELKKENTDMSELSREMLIEYMPILQDKNIELKVDIPDLSIMAVIDKDRVSRALRNIMDNALKHGSKGGFIRFSLRETEQMVQVELEDKGEGIDKEHLDRIFDRFYRVDKSRNSKDGGMGLGLAIADEIVRRHGGRIVVKSELGQGTSFTMSIPKDD